jgi:hypothetical protein
LCPHQLVQRRQRCHRQRLAERHLESGKDWHRETWREEDGKGRERDGARATKGGAREEYRGAPRARKRQRTILSPVASELQGEGEGEHLLRRRLLCGLFLRLGCLPLAGSRITTFAASDADVAKMSSASSNKEATVVGTAIGAAAAGAGVGTAAGAGTGAGAGAGAGLTREGTGAAKGASSSRNPNGPSSAGH